MKKYLILSLLFSITSNNNILAGNQINNQNQEQSQNNNKHNYFDAFFDSFVEEMNYMHKRMQRLEESLFNNHELTQESTSKTSVKKTDSVNLDINQNEQQVIIKLDIENMKLNELKDLDIKNNIIYGTISTENGKVNLAIANNYIEIAQKVKIKKQDVEGQEKEYLSRYWSSHQARNLPAKVNLDTTKVELTGNSLVITIDKEVTKKITINMPKTKIQTTEQKSIDQDDIIERLSK